MQYKICKRCGIEKPLTEFYRAPEGKYGVKSICKECYKKQRLAYWHKDRKKYYPEENITSLWSVSAIACMLRHCICQGCLMSDLESGCRMKHTVIKLVRVYGRPVQYKEPTII